MNSVPALTPFLYQYCLTSTDQATAVVYFTSRRKWRGHHGTAVRSLEPTAVLSICPPLRLPVVMFDESTGQVFQEWTLSRQAMSPQGIDAQDWSRRQPIASSSTSVRERGPRSLVAMTINVIHLQRRIWRFLEPSGVSLHAWKLFSKLLCLADAEKTLGLCRFRQHICEPDSALRRYSQPLTSLTADFITHLIIAGGCKFRANEMLCLAEMRNLGVLELLQPAESELASYPRLSNRLIRGWTEVKNPFPLLRILRICGGDQHATQESLPLVSQFPSLALYDVTASREDWPDPADLARAHGWNTAFLGPDKDDSLVDYLMLLLPPDQWHHVQPADLAKAIQTDLAALYGDSQIEVRFAACEEAIPLQGYMTDAAKGSMLAGGTGGDSQKRGTSCRQRPLETWAFWLYSFLGQVGHDSDLRRNGISVDSHLVAGPFILPSKPLACLSLGHGRRGRTELQWPYDHPWPLPMVHRVFTRLSIARATSETDPSSIPPNFVATETRDPALRRRKRQRLDDVLRDLSG
ncbi:hypothetical protein RJ55_07787 [Drechmeria coniospora]|nr:hypothetical protein RJ55_07787 [Drechmeria coniospora]